MKVHAVKHLELIQMYVVSESLEQSLSNRTDNLLYDNVIIKYVINDVCVSAVHSWDYNTILYYTDPKRS